MTAVATVVVGVSACGGSSGTTAKTPPSSSTASSTSPTTDTTTAQARPRTAVELKSALLQLGDLPTGFAIEPASGGDGGAGSASSKDPTCAPLVKLMNARTAPGSKASATVSLSGGQDGPFIDESIDALASADAVEALQASLKSAVAACRQLSITIPGRGSSTMKVTEVSAPKFGDHTLASRLTSTGGPLGGLQITQVPAGVKDVIVSITFVAAVPDDVDGGTEAAVGKAEDVLGGAASGA